MSVFEFTSQSSDETIKFGRKLAKLLKPADIICLCGNLGSGKTTMVKGIAEGLQVKSSKVTSPTFVMMNIYEGKLSLYHFDLYRVDQPKEINALGYEEFFYGDGVSLIEWAERLGDLMPQEFLKIEILHEGENTRGLKLTSVGKRYKTIIDSLKG